MALQNKLAIVNSALRKLGAETITALTDNVKAALVMTTRVEPAKQAVLRSHTWNFAVRRVILETKVAATAISGITLTGNNTVSITATSHGLAVRDRVYIEDVVGTTELNGNDYNVATVPDANTITLEGTDAADFTAWSSAGTVRRIPAYDFSNLFALPSDCLRLLPLARGYQYRVEGRYIATDEDELELKYVQDIALDDQTVDPLFAEALSAYLAWDTCAAIAESNTSKQVLWEDYMQVLRQAKFANATEGGHQQVIEANDFIDARTHFSHGLGYPRNG